MAQTETGYTDIDIFEGKEHNGGGKEERNGMNEKIFIGAHGYMDHKQTQK